MAYSELIKDFKRIRAYLRDFYVYGFKVRNDFSEKSARSYDNERRRVESWMGDYVSFSQDSRGKRVFLSMDSRSIPHNPLYRAYKAKSFTSKDILLHFYLMDLFRTREPWSFCHFRTDEGNSGGRTDTIFGEIFPKCIDFSLRVFVSSSESAGDILTSVPDYGMFFSAKWVEYLPFCIFSEKGKTSFPKLKLMEAHYEKDHRSADGYGNGPVPGCLRRQGRGSC